MASRISLEDTERVEYSKHRSGAVLTSRPDRLAIRTISPEPSVRRTPGIGANMIGWSGGKAANAGTSLARSPATTWSDSTSRHEPNSKAGQKKRRYFIA